MLEKRIKVIKLADRSEFGRSTVKEYLLEFPILRTKSAFFVLKGVLSFVLSRRLIVVGIEIRVF